MTASPPNARQLDALREVANIGCGHAANALSHLVGGRRVQIDVPRVVVASVGEMPELLGGADLSVVAATFDMVGDLRGHLLFVIPERDARVLTELLLSAPSQGELQGVERSALEEVANILASACLSSIAQLTRLRLLPSPPRLVQDSAARVLEHALAREAERAVMVALEAKFFTHHNPAISGQLVVLPDPGSISVLLGRLGV